MIRTLAGVGRECASVGMPFIAEAEFPTTYASVEELAARTDSSTCDATCASAPSSAPTS